LERLSAGSVRCSALVCRIEFFVDLLPMNNAGRLLLRWAAKQGIWRLALLASFIVLGNRRTAASRITLADMRMIAETKTSLPSPKIAAQ